MKKLVLFIVAVVLVCSCTTTKYVEVPVVHTDTLIVTNHQKDSVWLHDSIYQMEKGDTVLIEKWHKMELVESGLNQILVTLEKIENEN